MSGANQQKHLWKNTFQGDFDDAHVCPWNSENFQIVHWLFESLVQEPFMWLCNQCYVHYSMILLIYKSKTIKQHVSYLFLKKQTNKNKQKKKHPKTNKLKLCSIRVWKSQLANFPTYSLSHLIRLPQFKSTKKTKKKADNSLFFSSIKKPPPKTLTFTKDYWKVYEENTLAFERKKKNGIFLLIWHYSASLNEFSSKKKV